MAEANLTKGCFDQALVTDEGLQDWLRERLFYMPTPYSSADPLIREARFHLACDAAGMLLSGGTRVISPIAHTHPIACRKDLPKGWDFWQSYDRVMIDRCDGLIVIMVDGWMQSVGVWNEIMIAEALGKPVYYLPWPSSYADWLYTLRLGPEIVTKIYRISDSEVAP